jgi:hypothetical protein
VHRITAGDALALATRFDLGWAYRGGEALFWTAHFSAFAVHDTYLPAAARWPFERRGLIRIDGAYGQHPLALVATQLSNDRAARIRELRALRAELRAIAGSTMLFAGGMNGSERIAFGDLGLRCIASESDCAIFGREANTF